MGRKPARQIRLGRAMREGGVMSQKLNQGDIIKTNFTPQAGHEQAGYRPVGCCYLWIAIRPTKASFEYFAKKF